MLEHLYIENFAIIEQASVSFSKGLSVFTGETGAGKSIVIDAIHMICGDRAARELVRSGAGKAVTAAEFTDLPPIVCERLAEYGFEPEDALLLQREITADGKSTARINGRPATAQMLSYLTEYLIHIHGQHDSGILLSADRHIELIDRYAELSAEMAEYRAAYRELMEVNGEIRRLHTLEQEKAQRRELLSFQAKEIADAELRVGEEEELEQRRAELEHAAERAAAYKTAYAVLVGSDTVLGAADGAKAAADELNKLADFDPNAKAAAARLTELSAQLSELSGSFYRMSESVGDPEGDLNEIGARLDELYRLKRKYGNTVAEVIAYGEEIGGQLAELESTEQRLGVLRTEQNRLISLCKERAAVLSEKRSRAAARLAERVAEELRFLQMPHVRLEIAHTKGKYGPQGSDRMEFLFSPNLGEPPRPLSRIASGGELSRMMLALTNALADKEDIPTLIFDEVDTGVSGNGSQRIGRKLQEVAENRQVFSVTHSAQIAALADRHYLIQKGVANGRTVTHVTLLDDTGRVEEVARIMGADAVTDLMRATARQMIADGKRA